MEVDNNSIGQFTEQYKSHTTTIVGGSWDQRFMKDELLEYPVL